MKFIYLIAATVLMFSFSPYCKAQHSRQTQRKIEKMHGISSSCLFGYRVSQFELSKFKSYLKKQSWDQDRLKLACQFVKDSYLQTETIVLLMAAFKEDRTRLNFAKFAYEYVCDREHYYQVEKTFSWQGNVSKLRRFIAQY